MAQVYTVLKIAECTPELCEFLFMRNGVYVIQFAFFLTKKKKLNKEDLQNVPRMI